MKNKGKIRIGLWGCGNRTHALIKESLAKGRIKVVRCHDINQKLAETVAVNLGAKAVGSAEELLEAQDVDALLISLFPGAHSMALLKAIPTGKPIYIEKPIATNWEDYNRLNEIALSQATFVHVGLMHRYCPIFSEVTKQVKAGRIGRMIGVTVNWVCRLRPVEAFPGGMDNWHFRKDTGGELVQHFCHTFDWLRALGGDFTHISAMCNQIERTDIPIENTWDILLRYQSGALANFHSSMNNPRNSELGWVEGSAGSLEWEWYEPSYIKFYPNTHKKQPGEIIPLDMSDGKHEFGFIKFLDNLEAGLPPDISLRDGLWASLIPLMARRSDETRQALVFPPVG